MIAFQKNLIEWALVNLEKNITGPGRRAKGKIRSPIRSIASQPNRSIHSHFNHNDSYPPPRPFPLSAHLVITQVLHPLGKVPVITDGDVTLAESTAIIALINYIQEYLIDKYSIDGKLKAPSAGLGYLNNLYFTHFAEGSLLPLLIQRVQLRPTARGLLVQVKNERMDPEVRKYTAFVEAHLEKVDWFAGGPGLTAADFAMALPLEGLALLKIAGPKCLAYVVKIRAR
ncbi:Glutathione s-transferase [Mycena venus]|uniref:Glutathione s-transferase n=1 Tax=Mycena venus TaxID=2733690 RepID=A0A8H6WU07_9AGAR|nr:Glutathione s-transferase [Mycena venus]